MWANALYVDQCRDPAFVGLEKQSPVAVAGKLGGFAQCRDGSAHGARRRASGGNTARGEACAESCCDGIPYDSGHSPVSAQRRSSSAVKARPGARSDSSSAARTFASRSGERCSWPGGDEGCCLRCRGVRMRSLYHGGTSRAGSQVLASHLRARRSRVCPLTLSQRCRGEPPQSSGR